MPNLIQGPENGNTVVKPGVDIASSDGTGNFKIENRSNTVKLKNMHETHPQKF